MARKKYLDEDGEDSDGVQRKCQQQKDVQSVKPFHNHHNHFLGGGTKNEYRRSNSKNSDESDGAVGKQLLHLGLAIREMPGDGNCLFRALSDQITGSSRNHLEYRRAVVQYMKEFRGDFEPFVEDDVPFDKYVQRLSQAGTFAGNDAIVAFARLHNVSVVIHQINSPAWVIHPSKDSQEHQGSREVHIFYHDGNHYNSVRRIGDDSESPTNIRLHAQTSSNPSFTKSNGKKSPPHTACSNAQTSSESYSNSKYGSKRDEDYWVKDSEDVNRLVEEVMAQTNYPDPGLVRETLVDYNFDMVATIDFIISMSVVINQHQYQDQKLVNLNICATPEKKIADKLPDVGSTAASTPLTEKSSDKVQENSVISKVDADSIVVPENSVKSTNISLQEYTQSPVEESDDGSSGSPTETPISSQETETNNEGNNPVTRKEPKRSNRQKKELKRRERKREADRRRISSAPIVAEKENTVVMSHFGSLDI